MKLPRPSLPIGLSRLPGRFPPILRDLGRLPSQLGMGLAPSRDAGDSAASAAGRFLSCRLESAGAAYRLYVPSLYRGDKLPLVVMLHGCGQSAEDFAAGTRMNVVAEAAACLVAYPEQTHAANGGRCWNWFRPGDQRRGQGEPKLLTDIAADVRAQYAVDAGRVYVAGLSAGGAAAAVLAATYPDVFAAVGVHSGLSRGAAHDVVTAMAAMREGASGEPGGGPMPPAIVFHGDRDTTVHPRNADAVIAQFMPAAHLSAHQREGTREGGHRWRRTQYRDAADRVVLEHWNVHGLAHAWSGGSTAGSFTDPAGPDASREMLRFFLAQPRLAAG